MCARARCRCRRKRLRHKPHRPARAAIRKAAYPGIPEIERRYSLRRAFARPTHPHHSHGRCVAPMCRSARCVDVSCDLARLHCASSARGIALASIALASLRQCILPRDGANDRRSEAMDAEGGSAHHSHPQERIFYEAFLASFRAGDRRARWNVPRHRARQTQRKGKAR